MKYSCYTEEDFIKDGHFQKWILDPDPITEHFWLDWLEKNPDRAIVIENAANMVRLLDFDEHQLSPAALNDMWRHIIKNRDNKNLPKGGKSHFHNYRKTILRIAAVFIGIIVVLTIMPKGTEEIGPDKITLTLDDGTVLEVNDLASRSIRNISGQNNILQSKGSLLYPTGYDSISSTIAYNELTVPFGKKFELVLSDNSHIVLNAGTKIKYPVQFPSNGKREVFLEGEAYFSVTHDPKRPFLVVTDEMVTKVYGTEFNTSCYKDENNTSTVLVKGAVGIYRSGEAMGDGAPLMMVPGQRAVLQENNIEITKVDVSKFIAWKEGNLLFIDDTFEVVIKKLEREFNIEIENNYKELGKKKFTGSFNGEPIEDILKIFSGHTPFRYEIKNKKVVITNDPI